MRHMESARKTSKSKSSSTKRSKDRTPRSISPRVRFVVCVKSGGYVDLEPLKVYKIRHDSTAKAHGMLRVVDGSGEDYLFPASFFRPIQAPRTLFEIVEKQA